MYVWRKPSVPLYASITKKGTNLPFRCLMTFINSTGYTVSRDLRVLNGDRKIRRTVVCWIFSDDNFTLWKFPWMHTNF